jgi:acetyltransferase-like isoleucine patch superfamily enzyme
LHRFWLGVMKPRMGGNIHDHLVSTDDWGAEFRCTPLIVDIFKQRKVFFASEQSLTGGEIIRFEDGVALEPYILYPGTGSLWSMGSFSYSWSSWDRPKSLWNRQVSFGRYCSIATGCFMLGDRHPIEWATSSVVAYSVRTIHQKYSQWVSAMGDDFDWDHYDVTSAPKPGRDIDINVGHDVWFGDDVRLAHRVSVGTGAVVAAGAIVTRDVEPYMIVGGVPARVIRPRFSEKLIERFLASKWWEFSPDLWKSCDIRDPEKFLDDVEKVRSEKFLAPFSPETTTFRHILNDLRERIQ